MVLDMLLFFYLAARYTYVQVEKSKENRDEDKKEAAVAEAPLSSKPVADNVDKSILGTENKGFSDDTAM